MRSKMMFVLPILLLLIGTIIYVRSAGEKQNQWAEYYAAKKIKKQKGAKSGKQARIDKIQEYFKQIRTKFNEETSNYPANYLMVEYHKVKSSGNLKATDTIEWVQRGPGNVGGRTRGLIVDPDDATHNTWYAGSATGGAWKTTDGGETWDCLTESIPYQATTTLAMSPANTRVIYMGTGESFAGSLQVAGGGIFKSTDKGQAWNALSSTLNNEDFRYINRIIVNPQNENVVVAVTNTGIFRTTNGGLEWEEVYTAEDGVEDVVFEPDNFSVMYAGAHALGILKSVDTGKTWINTFPGLGPNKGRFELAVSPVNKNRVFASVSVPEKNAQIFISDDKALAWSVYEDNTNNINFLGGQGYYDNAIAAHPYNEDIVYVAGVDVWKLQLSDNTDSTNGEISAFYTEQSDTFLSWIPFNGNYLDGMNIGTDEGAIELSDTEFVSIEIRFGPGISQKAHRFTVPDDSTSGVPASDYSYEDYISVPFQVWDIVNDRQLMCSFRDQEKDGAFNLYERTGDDYGELGREYIFINTVPYNETTPDPSIAQQGGHIYKLLYFFWPTLAEGGTWEPENLPMSKVVVSYVYIPARLGDATCIADAYQKYGGNNSYEQSKGYGNTSIPGFHPDHHALKILPIDSGTGDFWILNANDGGLGISKDKGVTFTQIKKNYITTQFYGVAKKPGSNEYIGGTQDNGTWQSPIGENASLSSGYIFRLGGDGFETVWHTNSSNRVMGSVYENAIYRSIDGGKSWSPANKGISGDAPFITKLTMVPSAPDVVFAISENGIYKTTDFALSGWQKIAIEGNWAPNGITSAHQVEVSLANNNIVWAGGGMSDAAGIDLFISEDMGETFTSVKKPVNQINAYISAIATHPGNGSVAYVLYSIFGSSKVFRTEDKGNTWSDITEFTDGTSENGFPDVGCFSLFVFPDNTDRIWVGTEIGIIESTDNGSSWHYLESNLPTVAIWQILYQDGQIVLSTYGRGIWTYQYQEGTGIGEVVSDKTIPLDIFPNPVSGYLNIQSENNQPLGIETIKVFDMKGSLVLLKNMDSTKPYIKLDLSGVKQGGYVLVLNYSGGEVYSEKLMVEQ